nr:MAG TPA: hypothetical protein [Podoviridae sp. ctAV815]
MKHFVSRPPFYRFLKPRSASLQFPASLSAGNLTFIAR